MLQNRFRPDSALQTGEHSVTCLGVGRGGYQAQRVSASALEEQPLQTTDQSTELLGRLLVLPFLLLDLEDWSPST